MLDQNICCVNALFEKNPQQNKIISIIHTAVIFSDFVSFIFIFIYNYKMFIKIN